MKEKVPFPLVKEAIKKSREFAVEATITMVEIRRQKWKHLNTLQTAVGIQSCEQH